MKRWESVKSEGKHVYWRYGVEGHAVGYVAKNTVDCPPGQRAVEAHIAGPAARLLSTT